MPICPYCGEDILPEKGGEHLEKCLEIPRGGTPFGELRKRPGISSERDSDRIPDDQGAESRIWDFCRLK